ncbi:MAG: c-type cytochrome [Verrucomicrobia bacterium]|nr:c-type cytochrome [Verrucomicrobiota bacterium]
MNFSWPSILLSAGVSAGLFAMSGCDQLPGKPKESDRWQPPEAIKDFKTLFGANCSACHGDDTSIGPSISVQNPLYLAVIPKDILRKIIADGIKGTPMPGFAKANGGDLTDEQVDILVNDLTSKAAQQTNLPPYSAAPGDANHGSEVYNQYCANCHGQAGQGGEKAGAVVNPDYLHLVSDQYLRSVVIGGRPELGMWNYQEFVKGHPMSSQEIADVVAWLGSHRLTNQEGNAAASPTANGSSQ